MFRTQGGGPEELLLSTVKTEPRVHSPTQQDVVISGAQPTPGVGITVGVPTGTSNGGLFSNIASSNKRPRPDDWLASPSPGTIPPAQAPPLTPSPGPPSLPYTVISNGYSSPMSSGSYDPYSPNGKIAISTTEITLNKKIFQFE